MSGRVDPFATLKEPLPEFTTKVRAAKPVATETIERIAEENNFPSRQAKAPGPPRRKRRVYRTGRNQQFNAKATPETIERFYKLANERNVPLGELLRARARCARKRRGVRLGIRRNYFRLCATKTHNTQPVSRQAIKITPRVKRGMS